LKHQEGRFTWIDIRTIEPEVFFRPREWNIWLDIVEGTRFIAELLPLEKNDGEVSCHGTHSG
jgi:hypothetical protein